MFYFLQVLLQILSSLDKAYSARHEAQLEAARADLLSSSSSFQVVADEVREAQEATSKKWDKEMKSLKEQLSTNQKRTPHRDGPEPVALAFTPFRRSPHTSSCSI